MIRLYRALTECGAALGAVSQRVRLRLWSTAPEPMSGWFIIRHRDLIMVGGGVMPPSVARVERNKSSPTSGCTGARAPEIDRFL